MRLICVFSAFRAATKLNIRSQGLDSFNQNEAGPTAFSEVVDPAFCFRSAGGEAKMALKRSPAEEGELT